jgi:hypothetical protein
MDASGKADAGGKGPKKASPGLTEVIGRALTDEKFRETLFQNRAQALQNFQLSDADREALDSLSQSDLEAHAQRFGEGSASAMAIAVKVKGTF